MHSLHYVRSIMGQTSTLAILQFEPIQSNISFPLLAVSPYASAHMTEFSQTMATHKYKQNYLNCLKQSKPATTHHVRYTPIRENVPNILAGLGMFHNSFQSTFQM